MRGGGWKTPGFQTVTATTDGDILEIGYLQLGSGYLLLSRRQVNQVDSKEKQLLTLR